ncbi:MAG TPA: hypothetical protein VIT00_04185 [Terrimicrobiaceae bacterium]
MILCPTQKIEGCQVIVNPEGRPAKPVKCLRSHCRTDEPKIVDGKKVCSFSCPQYYIE